MTTMRQALQRKLDQEAAADSKAERAKGVQEARNALMRQLREVFGVKGGVEFYISARSINSELVDIEIVNSATGGTFFITLYANCKFDAARRVIEAATSAAFPRDTD